MNPLLRELFCWKFVFYSLLLPVLRRLGPVRCDAALRRLGQALAVLCPGRKKRLQAALMAVQPALERDAPAAALWLDLAAGSARFQARDCTLEGSSEKALWRGSMSREMSAFSKLWRPAAARFSSAATTVRTLPACTGWPAPGCPCAPSSSVHGTSRVNCARGSMKPDPRIRRARCSCAAI